MKDINTWQTQNSTNMSKWCANFTWKAGSPGGIWPVNVNRHLSLLSWDNLPFKRIDSPREELFCLYAKRGAHHFLAFSLRPKQSLWNISRVCITTTVSQLYQVDRITISLFVNRETAVLCNAIRYEPPLDTMGSQGQWWQQEEGKKSLELFVHIIA